VISNKVANTSQTGTSEVLASFESTFHRIEAQKNFLIVKKKLLPKTEEIRYKDIANVEHKRLIDYGRFLGVIAGGILAFLLLFVKFVRDIITQLTFDITHATGMSSSLTLDASTISLANQAMLLLAGFFIIIAAYYLIRFIFSLGQRIIIYRQGKKPVTAPLPLTGDAFNLLKKINEKVKSEGGISKAEAEKIISDQLKGLIEDRMKMQEKMLNSLKLKAMTVKTDEDKAKLREMMENSIQKLEAQDEAIEVELQKTGLNKEDLFKKYRIRPPKQEFIDSVLKDGNLSGLLGEK
jgi:hypothetical protein